MKAEIFGCAAQLEASERTSDLMSLAQKEISDLKLEWAELSEAGGVMLKNSEQIVVRE